MLTQEQFRTLIEEAKTQDAWIDAVDNAGIPIFEHPICEFGWRMFENFLNCHFNEYGIDHINWWLWEKNPPYAGEPNELYDENDNLILTDTIDDLWELVKEYQI